jgi:hypothetical protein
MDFYNGLPEYCFSTEEMTDEVILLKRGQVGYFPYYEGTIKGKEAARELNNEIGVSAAEAAAMKIGSMFGWNLPGANPERYDENGRVK